MLRNYFTLYHLARELHELLEGGFAFESHSQQRNEITISLITNTGNHLQLIVVTSHPRLCIYTREGLNRKQRNTADLMPEINEKNVLGVVMDPCDRIIRIPLENNYTIVLQLFSAKTNVFLESNGKVIRAFKQNTSTFIHDKDGKPDTCPEIFRLFESLVHDRAFFIERFRETDADDDAEKLRQMLPGFDRLLVRELLGRCGNSRSPEKIHAEFTTLFYELLDPLPSVHIEGKNGPEFSILHNPPKTSVKLETILEGLNFYSIKTWQYLRMRELVHELDNKLRHKMTKIERELAHFQPEKLMKQADEYERNGHLLIANLYNPKRKKDYITVTNVFDPSAPILTIPLKPELNMQQNAAAWFRKASKIREKIQGGIRRIATVKVQQEELDRLLTISSELSSPSEVRDFYETNRSALNILGLSDKSGKEKDRLSFRKFDITQKAVLYIGKNARNNDQLTFSFAKPNDIWLHARGASGSHCILRGATMQNISEIQRAAEIAAYYSAAKHSEFAPVMYTEKKYVRRSRNMPPGQVLVEKEKVIMVRPSE